MKETYLRTVLVILSIGAAFILSLVIPPELELQFVAVVFASYYILKKSTSHVFIGKASSTIDAVAFTLIFIHVVLTTGGLQSDYFFLLYFLIFALSLLLEPVASITTSIGIVLLFFMTESFNYSLANIIPLLSLPLLAPFALMLGNEYKKDIMFEKKLSREQDDSHLFIFLVVKGHLKTIDDALKNFNGDEELKTAQRTVKRLHKLIDDYEETH